MPNNTLLNFIGGELSPRMAGRTDLDIFAKSFSWCQNFICLPQGPVSYRPGTALVALTPNNLPLPTLIPFQFSANDAVMVVANGQATNTTSYFNFYRNDGAILDPATVTGTFPPYNIFTISKASPAVVTVTGTWNVAAYPTNSIVFISGLVGYPSLNNRYYLVVVTGSNTVQLYDAFSGAPINTIGMTGYSNGTGNIFATIGISSIYAPQDMPFIRTAQAGDVMYMTCNNTQAARAYPPQKLIRNSLTNWVQQAVVFTASPFTPTDTLTPTAITKANPPVVTAVAAGIAQFTVGQIVSINTTGGMTQINNTMATIFAKLTTTTLSLGDLNGNPLDSTSFSTFTAGGTINSVDAWPTTVAFTADGRLSYGGSQQIPQGWWGSELPVGATSKFDNFTTGSAATFGFAFEFAPVANEIDTIQEIVQFSGNFAILGPSSILQVYGASPGQPANPNAINTVPTIQGSARVRPLVINWDLVFVDVDGQTLRGLQFNFAYSSYEAVNYSLSSDHMGEEATFIKQVYVKWTQGSFIWVLRSDGALLCVTFDNTNNIAAWTRHYLGGSAVVNDIATIRKPTGDDELWLGVQRTLNGATYNTLEVMEQWQLLPLRRAFFTNPNNQASDELAWEAATFEALKDGNFLDMAITYDGTARGTAAAASIFPSAKTGSGIVMNATQGVFSPDDVGQQIWKSYVQQPGWPATVTGGGMAVITSFVSPTQVIVSTLAGADFDNINTIPAGLWSIATNTITNLADFPGVTFNVQADSGYHHPVTVASGAVTLDFPCSNIKLGLTYTGMFATNNLTNDGKQGSTASKPRNIARVRTRFDNTMGGQIGTSEYIVNEVVFRKPGQIMNRVPPPYTGMVDKAINDKWGPSVKQIVFVQTDPTPCTIVALDIEMAVTEPNTK